MNSLYIASDHAGFDLKKMIFKSLKEIYASFSIHDLGPFTGEISVDFPDFAQSVVEKMPTGSASDPVSSFGILICGSGQGMTMAANRYSNIRAALCHNESSALLARVHNNANVLCLGARIITPQEATTITSTFLSASFEGGRHSYRVQKLTELPKKR